MAEQEADIAQKERELAQLTIQEQEIDKLKKDVKK